MSVLPSVDEIRTIILASKTEEELQGVLSELVTQNPMLENMEKVLYKLAAKELGITINVNLSSLIDPDAIQDQNDTTIIKEFSKTLLSVINLNAWIINVGSERLTKNDNVMRFLIVADESGVADIQMFDPVCTDFVAAGLKSGDPINIMGLQIKDEDNNIWTRMGNYTQYKEWEEDDGPLCSEDDVYQRKIANIRDKKFEMVGGMAVTELTEIGTYSGCPECHSSLKVPADSRVLCRKCKKTIVAEECKRNGFVIADDTGDIRIDIPPWVSINDLPKFDMGDTLLVYGQYQKSRKSISCAAVLLRDKSTIKVQPAKKVKKLLSKPIKKEKPEEKIDDKEYQFAVDRFLLHALNNGHDTIKKLKTALENNVRVKPSYIKKRFDVWDELGLIASTKGKYTPMHESWELIADCLDYKIEDYQPNEEYSDFGICNSCNEHKNSVCGGTGSCFECDEKLTLKAGEDTTDEEVIEEKPTVVDVPDVKVKTKKKSESLTIADLNLGDESEFEEPSDEVIAGCASHWLTIIKLWGSIEPTALRNVLSKREGGIKYQMAPIIADILDRGTAQIVQRGERIALQKK